MGFKLEDITEEFLAKVVFYGFHRPSGLGDTAGSITMLTEDGQEYFIAGEGFELPFSDWGETFPVFDGHGVFDADGELANPGDCEWIAYQVPFGHAVIRREYAEAFASRGGYGGRGCGELFPSAIAAEVMG